MADVRGAALLRARPRGRAPPLEEEDASFAVMPDGSRRGLRRISGLEREPRDTSRRSTSRESTARRAILTSPTSPVTTAQQGVTSDSRSVARPVRRSALNFAIGQAGDALGIPTSLSDFAELAGFDPGRILGNAFGLTPATFAGPGEFAGLPAGGFGPAISPFGFLQGAALSAFLSAVLGPKNDPFRQAALANNALLRSSITQGPAEAGGGDVARASQGEIARSRALGVGLSAQSGDTRAQQALETLAPSLRELATTPGLRQGGREGTLIGVRRPGQRFTSLSGASALSGSPARRERRLG